MDNLSIKRFLECGEAERARPIDCVQTVLDDIPKEKIRSVYIIAVDENNQYITYCAGPDIGTYEKSWQVLQNEVFRLMAKFFNR